MPLRDLFGSPVRVVNFDDVESGHDSTHRGADKVGLDLLDLPQGHLSWVGEPLAEWDRTRTHDIIRPSVGVQVGGVAEAEEWWDSARLSSSMGDLDTDLLVLGMSELYMFR